MLTGQSRNEVIAALRFIDICIEIESNAVEEYRKMAFDAETECTRALMAWFYNNERTRLRRLGEERRDLLRRFPGLSEDGGYVPRKNGGLTKVGPGWERVLRKGSLAIMSWAIENEARAKKYFERKAELSRDVNIKSLMKFAAIEQADRMAYLGNHREMLLANTPVKGAEELAVITA